MEHGISHLMNHAAPKMNRILSKLSVDLCMIPFKLYIFHLEQPQVFLHNHAPHLHGRMAGFRIHAAYISRTHRQIHIPHDFAVDALRNLADLLLRKIFPVIENHGFQRRRLNVAGGKPVCQSHQDDNQIFLIVHLLQPVFIIRHPPAAAKRCHRLLRLDLIAGKQAGLSLLQFLRKLYIQLPEYLLKGLSDLSRK